MKPAKYLRTLFKQSDVTVDAKLDNRTINDALSAFERPNLKTSAIHSDLWRIIMKNRITKLAAAAVIVVTLVVWSIMPGTVLPTAYALQDTIEAYNSIRYLHVSEFETVGQERRPSELWVACDHYGYLNRMRSEAPNSGGPVLGAAVLVSDGSISEVWFKNHNLCFKTVGNGEAVLRWEISELDPKLAFERLYEQEEQGEIILDVNEPEEKSKPIVITVTYPEGSLSEAYKKVFYIDQATELVKKIEKFQMRDGTYHHVRTAEFSGYNDDIDPMMFSFDGELPEDTIYLDRSTEEIGLAQGNMSDEQVVAEVGRKFFEAIVAKDFDKAGLMWSGAPGLIIEKLFAGANAVKIISVGESRPDPDPDSTSMIGSCKVLLEFGGEHFELDANLIFVRRMSAQPDRWIISGMASCVQPVE
jgi:hypothetical protein